jgi:hypothetical protein
MAGFVAKLQAFGPIENGKIRVIMKSTDGARLTFEGDLSHRDCASAAAFVMESADKETSRRMDADQKKKKGAK